MKLSTRSGLVGATVLLAVGLSAGCSAGVKDTASTASDSSSSTASGAASGPSDSSNPSTPSSPTPSPSAAQPSDSSGGIPTQVSVPSITGLPTGLPTGGPGTPPSQASTPGAAPTYLPERFPLPSGTRVVNSVKDGKELAATLTVPDAAKAYSFWKSSLPGAGYRVTSAQTVGANSEIRFSGHGCGGNSQIAITSSGVAVQCELS